MSVQSAVSSAASASGHVPDAATDAILPAEPQYMAGGFAALCAPANKHIEVSKWCSVNVLTPPLSEAVGGCSQTAHQSRLPELPCDRCVDGTTKQSAGLSERGLALTEVSAIVSVPPTGGGSPSRHPCGLVASEQAAAQLPMTPCN